MASMIHVRQGGNAHVHGLFVGLVMALVTIMIGVAWVTSRLLAPPAIIAPVPNENAMLVGAVVALIISYLAFVPGRGYVRSLRRRLRVAGKDHWIRRWRILAVVQLVKVGRILAPLTYVAIATMTPGVALVAAIVFAAVWLLRQHPAAIANSYDLWSKGATWEEARRATRLGVRGPMIRDREELLAAIENQYDVQRQLALHDQVLL